MRARTLLSIAATVAISVSSSALPMTDSGLAKQTAELTASDGTTGSLFGFSMAISGDTAVISAPAIASNGAGAAYVFENLQQGWVQVAKLTPSDGYPGDRFGYAVAIAGSTIVVGNDTDAAYVYVEPVSGWTNTIETAELRNLVPSFAGSVAISADEKTVVASGDCDADDAAIFYKPSNGWENTNHVDAGLELPGEGEVAISGGVIVIGALDCSSRFSGQVGLFHLNRCHCVQQPFQTLIPQDGKGGDGFGSSISISGTSIIIGAPGLEAAYIFSNSAAGMTQVAKLTVPAGPDACIGCEVALVNNIALLGAPTLRYQSKSEQGGAFVFQKPATGWTDSSTPTALIVASDGQSNDQFGTSISAEQDVSIAFIGAPNHSVNGNAQQGVAYIFGP